MQTLPAFEAVSIKHVHNLDQLFIFLILDSIDLNLHFVEERTDLVLQVDTVLFVRVKTNENPLTRMDHVEVVVTDLFIMLVVAPMGKLVRFDAKKSVADEFTVIDPSTVSAVTVARPKRRIVHEPFVNGIDRVLNSYFFHVLVNSLASGIFGELSLEARRAVAIVLV
jgi:hypothetical protein